MTQELNLMTSVSRTGYGVVGRNIAVELANLGAHITLWPYGNIADVDEYTDALSMMAELDGYNPEAPCLNIWHQFDLAKRVGNGTYLAWPFFELNRFTDREKAHLKTPDIIVAACEWAKSIIEAEIPNAVVKKVPCGVDTSVFKPSDEPRGDRPYTFFNIGKWEKRKGHDVLIRCFDKAFDIQDDVHLVMMPFNPFLRPQQHQEWTERYQSAKLGSKVTLLNPVQAHSDVAHIINRCDCGVFPSRAEGWNLELLEAMACGKPVIATNNTAHMEFCDGVNSFLIETPELEDAFDGIFFNGAGQWAEFDIEEEDQLIEHMRYCYKERPDNTSGIATAEKFSWVASADKILEIL